jgi:hypothetical protein
MAGQSQASSRGSNRRCTRGNGTDAAKSLKSVYLRLYFVGTITALKTEKET